TRSPGSTRRMGGMSGCHLLWPTPGWSARLFERSTLTRWTLPATVMVFLAPSLGSGRRCLRSVDGVEETEHVLTWRVGQLRRPVQIGSIEGQADVVSVRIVGVVDAQGDLVAVQVIAVGEHLVLLAQVLG